MSDKKTVSKIVAWCVPKRALIKFDGDDDSITISKNVLDKTDFAKYPLAKGDTVDVSIEGDEVVYIRKSGDASPVKEEAKEEAKTEEKVETKAEASVDSVELTKEVYCVSKYGLKFVGDNDWTNFTDELQKKDVRSMGVVAKNTITVVLQAGKIVEIKKVEVQKESEKVEKESTSSSSRKSSYRDEESTDKRTASMNAKDVVVALINASREEVNSTDKIEKAINVLTKKFYEVTKNL